MQLLEEKAREGFVRVRVEHLDDLWELTHIIAEDDEISGKTERKITLGEDRTKSIRKTMQLSVRVVKLELEHDALRIQGVITQGPEDLVSFGDHHSFSLTPGEEFGLKKQWDPLTRARFEKALDAKPLNVLLVTFDREQAHFAELTRRGYDMLTTLQGDVAKKAPGGGNENFWKSIATAIHDIDAKKAYARIVIASPAFWTEYLLRTLPKNIAKKTITATVGHVGAQAMRELAQRPEVMQALKEDATLQEEALLAQVLSAIAQDSGCYGIDECEEKASLGQIHTLIVSQDTLQRMREDNTHERLYDILKTVENTGGSTRLLEHQTQQLDALGGVAGVLRW